MATWLIAHADAIAQVFAGFIGGVVFAAWRQVSIEAEEAIQPTLDGSPEGLL